MLIFFYFDSHLYHLLKHLVLLFFLSLFYVYDLVLKHTDCWKRQLLYFAGFILFLAGLRYFMQAFRLPPTIYRLPIFDETFSKKNIYYFYR